MTILDMVEQLHALNEWTRERRGRSWTLSVDNTWSNKIEYTISICDGNTEYLDIPTASLEACFAQIKEFLYQRRQPCLNHNTNL